MKYRNYTIANTGDPSFPIYTVYDPQGKRVDSTLLGSVAKHIVDEDIMHRQRRYIVTTAGGGFVGLFNYGRTYKAADAPCVLDCDLKTARSLAETFGGRVYRLDYNKHDARPWTLLADCGQFWQQSGNNYFYRGRCINQLKAA